MAKARKEKWTWLLSHFCNCLRLKYLTFYDFAHHDCPLQSQNGNFPLFALLVNASVTNQLILTTRGRAEARRFRIRINIAPSVDRHLASQRLGGYATGRAPAPSRLLTHTTCRRWRRISRRALTSVELFKTLTHSVERRVRLPVKEAASPLLSDLSLTAKCIGWQIAAPRANAQHAAHWPCT